MRDWAGGGLEGERGYSVSMKNTSTEKKHSRSMADMYTNIIFLG